MISVREYADSRGKTHQAVYKQMKSKKNSTLLEGHTYKKEGKLWLDDEAVRVLDESSKQSPVVVIQEQEDEKTEEMQAKLNDMRDLVIDLQQKLLESRKTIADTQYKMGMLESKARQTNELKKENATLIEEVARLKTELEAEKNKSWIAKLFNRPTRFVD